MKRLTRFVVGGLTAISLAAIGTTAHPAAGATETCNLKSQQINGLNKICYYQCPSGNAAYTVRSVDLCPINIKR